MQDYCMQVGNAYVIVYSITDRSTFESASELRIQLRRIRQAENIPIILVGNKSDLVRCREVTVEGESAHFCILISMVQKFNKSLVFCLYFITCMLTSNIQMIAMV